jgi:uncharacterized protein
MLDKVNKYSINDIRLAISKAGSDSLVYVGTDSKQSKYQTTFITVVIIHKGAKSSTGGRGCEVFPFVTSVPKIKNLKQKLLEEVNIAMKYALDLVYDEEGNIVVPLDIVEVHMDINPNPKHKSSIAVKEAVSYVTGQGLTAKVKPDALASTGASDWLGRRPNLTLEVAS